MHPMSTAAWCWCGSDSSNGHHLHTSISGKSKSLKRSFTFATFRSSCSSYFFTSTTGTYDIVARQWDCLTRVGRCTQTASLLSGDFSTYPLGCLCAISNEHTAARLNVFPKPDRSVQSDKHSASIASCLKIH
jgi:hypothetical protein